MFETESENLEPIHANSESQKAFEKSKKAKNKQRFETGVNGLDTMLEGGIRWGSTVTIASDSVDKEKLCHQLVKNALKRGFIVYYLCFKEAPERLRLTMNEDGFNAEHYEKRGLLQFYTPLETELTRRLKDSAELIREFDKFITRMMRDVALKVVTRKKVLIVSNNVSAIYSMLSEDPKWKDFITKGSSWLRRLVKVVGVQLADLKDAEAADTIADFCIIMKSMDGVPYIKATKVSSVGWVPYRSTPNGIEIAEEFVVW
jgi:KaiC/GvpD/RAD55 family RecA-like ATPase